MLPEPVVGERYNADLQPSAPPRTAPLGLLPPARPAPPRPARIEPLSLARYKVEFTASQALKQKIERTQNLLRHANPSGDLAWVVERALDLLLVDLEKKKLGQAKRPRLRPTPAKDPGTIPRAVRREVFARDGEQCAFVDAQGHRCSARAFLELDHIQARARNGSGETHIVRVLCQAHNRFAAEQAFGRDPIERAIQLRRRRKGETKARGPAVAPIPKQLAPASPAQADERGRVNRRGRAPAREPQAPRHSARREELTRSKRSLLTLPLVGLTRR